MSIDKLLSRLDRVRQTGAGRWIAACPAHKDRSPSLSIRRLYDGRMLLHCFAGCEIETILSAGGLKFSDLYPEQGGGKHFYRPVRRSIPAADLLGLMDHESMIVSLIAGDFLEHRAIDIATWHRLGQAVARIGAARDAASPARAAR